MTDRKKSRKEKKIEESLGIGGAKDDDFDMSEEIDNESEEDHAAKEKLENRREIATTTKNALAKYSEKEDRGYDSDEEFSRDILRDIAVTGSTLLKIQEEEMQLDPSPRIAETAASLMTSVTTAVDKLTGIGLSRRKLDIDQQKADRGDGPNSVTNNFIGVSSFSDLVKNIKESGEDMGKVSTPDANPTIEVEAEVVDSDEDNDEG